MAHCQRIADAISNGSDADYASIDVKPSHFSDWKEARGWWSGSSLSLPIHTLHSYIDCSILELRDPIIGRVEGRDEVRVSRSVEQYLLGAESGHRVEGAEGRVLEDRVRWAGD